MATCAHLAVRCFVSRVCAQARKPVAPVPRRLALLTSLLGLSALSKTFAAAASSPGDPSCANPMVGLEESGIVPDLVDRVSPAGGAELVVEFHGKRIQNGQLLKPSEAAAAPKVHVKGGAEGGLFTVVSSDPDPPDPANPVYREWLHGIWTNIPAGGELSQGHQVESWLGPSPPIGTHRYVFMLFQQPNQEPLQASAPKERRKFDTRAFAKAHNLGDPVAVAWFNSHK